MTSFAVALGLVALGSGALVSAGSYVALPLARRLGPERRVEVAAWLALLPALTAVAVAASVAFPSLLFGLGLASDHCAGHGHHSHLCPWHGSERAGAPLWIAAVGLGAWSVRGAAALRSLVRAEVAGVRLAAMGVARDGAVVVGARVPVCHAVGVLRPTVIVSGSVLDGLSGPERRGAAGRRSRRR